MVKPSIYHGLIDSETKKKKVLPVMKTPTYIYGYVTPVATFRARV